MVASELRRTTSRSITEISTVTTLILVGFYGLIAAGGYLSFLGAVQQDVLTNYVLSNAVTTCRIFLSCSIIVGVPTSVAPCARSLRNLMQVWAPSKNGKTPNEAEETLLPSEND